MFPNNIKRAGVVAFVGGFAFTGIGVMARQDAAAKKAETPSAAKPAADSALPTQPAAGPTGKVPAPNTDAPHELAKIDDLHKGHLKAATRVWEQAHKEFLASNTGLERAYQASRRLMDAQLVLANTRDEKVSAANEHFARVREIARAQHANPSFNELQSAQVRAYAAEAEIWVAQANAVEAGKHGAAKTGERTFGGHGKDPASQRILAKLEEPVSMSFHDDTPLEDVLKYIKQATTTATYAGIPIYVDPLGLQEAEKSMTSTVRNMDLEGVPLRRTLHLLLKQLDLAYFVDDGVLYITSADAEGPLGPAMREPPPILQRAEKAERGELPLTEMKELLEIFKVREQLMKLSSGAPTEETTEPTPNEEVKQYREQVNLLLKEIRGLLEILKVEKQNSRASRSQ